MFSINKIIKLQIIKYLLIVIILLNSVKLITTESPIEQLHIIFRHGDRTPTETYPNDPYKNFSWPGGWGQLTNRGKFQMYSLGLQLRKQYSDFIPDYYFHKSVNVSSSYSDRCLMSAQALLAGLFPPKKDQIWNKNLLWQPIPVHYLPRTQDNLLAMKAPCPKYDRTLIEVQNSGAIKAINEANSELFDYITKHTGEIVDNINKLEFLYNTLEIEQLHNLTLPQWTQNISFNHMKSLAARSLESYVETAFMKRMKGGVLLKKVISSMKNHGENQPIINLYSAHDITLVNVLKTVGYNNSLKPDFAANLIIEFHNNTQVKLIYRNGLNADPEEVSSPDLLQDFENKLQDLLPLDWTKECIDN